MQTDRREVDDKEGTGLGDLWAEGEGLKARSPCRHIACADGGAVSSVEGTRLEEDEVLREDAFSDKGRNLAQAGLREKPCQLT